MWKKLLAWILVTVILTGYGIQIVEAFDQKENVRMEEVTEKPDQNSLYAKAAVLMDADSGSILYEKNGHQAMANASTTKILTCIIALENCDLDSEVTVSTLAASQPKVHLGMREGQKFYLKDLLYGLMLESYNDCAVAIAEHIAGTTGDFAKLMNDKAEEIGCEDSYFITPNGLDAKNENGFHHTTAADLSLIMRYCIKTSEMAEQFLTITREGQYQFSDIDGKNSYTCCNHNAFLQMMDGALSGKTGFTGNAGYCYVGALKRDDRTFIVALLACGWPNNKTYKWAVFSMISPASFGFFISAEPSPLLTTFGTGQPMLMSKMSNGLSSICFAISLMISGSEPNSCSDTGFSRLSIVKSSSVFLFL